MKMYPYLPNDEKKAFLENMEKYTKNLNNNKYYSFFKYFKRVWAKEEFVKFDKLNASEFNKRTNNICEWFHKKLNDSIEGYHPKIAYLINKLKDFSINSYNQYKIQKTLFKNEIKSGFNIADDVYKFLKKFKKNYKCMPNFDNILQLKESEEADINNLIREIMEILYHFDFDENESDSELNYSDDEERENISNEPEGDELIENKELKKNISEDNEFYEKEISDIKLKNKDLY